MNIVVKNLQQKVPINQNQIKSVIQRLTSRLNISEESTINIVFVGDKAMQTLNNRYLKHNFPTDVLAFNFSRQKIKAGITLNGDIIINTEIALRNAPVYRNPVKKEIALYIIHGVLHLLGFNDKKTGEKRIMQEYQNQLLNELSVR